MKKETLEENISLTNKELLGEIEKMEISKEDEKDIEKLILGNNEKNISEETKKLIKEIEKETSKSDVLKTDEQQKKIKEKYFIDNKGVIGGIFSLIWSIVLMILLIILSIYFSLFILFLLILPMISIATNILFLKGKNNKVLAATFSFLTLGVGIVAGILILLSKKEKIFNANNKPKKPK